MNNLYAITNSDGWPMVVFATQAQAIRHLIDMGHDDWYHVQEIAFYPEGDEPKAQRYWRAGGQGGRIEAYERVQWDWQPEPMESERYTEDLDGVARGGDNSPRLPYFYAVSKDKRTAEMAVVRALREFHGQPA